MAYTLQLVQKLTVMKNVWHLTRTDGTPVELGTIAQARMKLREQVTGTAADGSGVLFAIKARKIVELASTYDVTDGDGAAIGTIAKDFRASLGRSTYRVETPAGTWTVTETSAAKAIARRVVGVATDLSWLFRVQFSILDADGRAVGHVNRANLRIRDTYEVRVEDDALDQRVAAAVGVAVDAFMNR